MNPITVKLLYALLALGFIFTIWPSANDQEEAANIKLWHTAVDATGNLNVMGVTLGVSSLIEAEKALHSLSEQALFIDVKDGKHIGDSVEAFFPTSPDRAKLVLELEASADLIARIKNKAGEATVFPSGNAKIDIDPELIIETKALVVRSLTYIPSISLSVEMIESNFGTPSETIRDQEQNLHMLYPALGLDAVIPAGGKPLLQFVKPSEFSRLRDLVIEQAPAETPATEIPL